MTAKKYLKLRSELIDLTLILETSVFNSKPYKKALKKAAKIKKKLSKVSEYTKVAGEMLTQIIFNLENQETKK